MRDAVGVGDKARIVEQRLATHGLQQVLPVRLGDDMDRDMAVGGSYTLYGAVVRPAWRLPVRGGARPVRW